MSCGERFMSEITAFACGFNVRDWAYCDGSIQQIGQNPSLFDLIGTPFGVRDPYLGVGYQICVYGLYPARGT